MNEQSFSTTVAVDASPAQAYEAITTGVAGWWPDIEGGTQQVGDEFVHTAHGHGHRCRQRVTEAVPNERVVWHVLENYFGDNQDEEWKDTQIRFDITERGGTTELRFEHVGLVPRFECYDSCSVAWTSLISSDLAEQVAASLATER